MKKVAVIGVGLIGKERLKAIDILVKQGRKIKVVGIFDPYKKEIQDIAKEFNTTPFSNLNELIKTNPDWIFIATPHDTATNLLKETLKFGHKILVEKPLGRTIKECQELINKTSFSDQLWIGFNYRFFEGISSAINDIKNGVFGKLVSVNFILGHGGSSDMRLSWKLDPIRAGGGCLIDPGVHALDLCRIISNGCIKVKCGSFWKGFWNTGIEEESHILFNCKDFIINLQVSLLRWRSTFIMEINGTEGYGIVTGRNRSYGKQTYIRGKRWGWLSGESQRESEELVIESSGDDVFAKEIDALFFPNDKLVLGPCNSREVLENMKLLEDCYIALNLIPIEFNKTS